MHPKQILHANVTRPESSRPHFCLQPSNPPPFVVPSPCFIITDSSGRHAPSCEHTTQKNHPQKQLKHVLASPRIFLIASAWHPTQQQQAGTSEGLLGSSCQAVRLKTLCPITLKASDDEQRRTLIPLFRSASRVGLPPVACHSFRKCGPIPVELPQSSSFRNFYIR